MAFHIINPDVRAVVQSLDNDPEAWKPHYLWGAELCELRHRESRVRVWCLNRSYGVEILASNGSPIWGGVGWLSSFGLNINHWLLSNAIRRWDVAHPLEGHATSVHLSEILSSAS